MLSEEMELIGRRSDVSSKAAVGRDGRPLFWCCRCGHPATDSLFQLSLLSSALLSPTTMQRRSLTTMQTRFHGTQRKTLYLVS